MTQAIKKTAILIGLCTLINTGCHAEEKHTTENTAAKQPTDSQTRLQAETKSTLSTPAEPASTDELEKTSASGGQQHSTNNLHPMADYDAMEDYLNVTTKDDIEKVFGKENTQAGQTSFAEGEFVQAHIMVTNLANGHQVKYLLNEDEKTVDAVEFVYQPYDEQGNAQKKQSIHAKSGLHTGMSLAKLLQWNDNEAIYFSGFGWDFGGSIMASESYLNPNSKLAKSGYGITLDYDGEGDNFYVPDDYIGDVELSTKDKKVLNSPIVVNVVTIRINKDSE